MNIPKRFGLLVFLLFLISATSLEAAEDALNDLSNRLVYSLGSLKDDVVLAVLDMVSHGIVDMKVGEISSEYYAVLKYGF